MNENATLQCCNGNAVTESTPAVKTFTPRVDLVETESALLLFFDIPGVRREDIDLRYEQGELTLRGKVQPRVAKGRVVFAEYDSGDFCRVFQVHESIDASKIEADFKNGVLKVTLPKPEAVKPKQVPIKVQA